MSTTLLEPAPKAIQRNGLPDFGVKEVPDNIQKLFVDEPVDHGFKPELLQNNKQIHQHDHNCNYKHDHDHQIEIKPKQQEIAKVERDPTAPAKSINKFMDQRSSLEKKIINFIQSDLIQEKFRFTWNAVNTLGNLYAIVVNMLPSVSQETKDNAYGLGSFSTKLALLSNFTVGGLNQIIAKRNILVAAGQFLENFVAVTANFDTLFLKRGLAYGLNLLGVGLNRGAQRKEFASMGECFKSLPGGLWQVIKDLKKPLSNLINAESGLLSCFNGGMIMLGAAVGLYGGKPVLGTAIRNNFSMLQAIDRLKSYVVQPKYFKSGVCHLFGAGLNQIGVYLPKWKRFFNPLGFIADGFGRDFYRQSIDDGEQVTKVPTKHNTFVIIFKKISDFFAQNHTIDPQDQELLADIEKTLA